MNGGTTNKIRRTFQRETIRGYTSRDTDPLIFARKKGKKALDHGIFDQTLHAANCLDGGRDGLKE